MNHDSSQHVHSVYSVKCLWQRKLVTQLARCLEAELSHTRPCCQADRTPQHLEWVKGNRARNRYGACVGHNADHREAAVFQFHQLQLIELLRIGSDGWDTKVTRELCRRVLVLPENLKRADGKDHLPNACSRHLGGGGNRIGRCRDLGKGELLRRRDHALEVRARRSPSPAHIGKHSHPAVLEFSSTHELQVPLVHFLGQLEWVPDLAASLDGDADHVTRGHVN
mmetsp:Transcript_35522/g.86326  ORF Transcript_35522/g.86326 Transcript_35522/m.86326 type:complete len:224 (+) Transcript_35522:75-746(+)